MKINLDLNDIGEATAALGAYMEHMRAFPNARPGESQTILVRDQKFVVTLNQSSTTVKAGKA